MSGFRFVRYTIKKIRSNEVNSDEWVVRFFGLNGEYDEQQTYYTDDYNDAVETAKAEMRMKR